MASQALIKNGTSLSAHAGRAREARSALPVVAHVPRVASGERLGTIVIARLNESVPFFEGISTNVLAGGPGHYPSTQLPGQIGTVAIAGHRVTHTRPFLRINLLRKGDPIVLKTSWGRFVYRVVGMKIVEPKDVDVLRNRYPQELVLTACHPPHTSKMRLVVIARRVA